MYVTFTLINLTNMYLNHYKQTFPTCRRIGFLIGIAICIGVVTVMYRYEEKWKMVNLTLVSKLRSYFRPQSNQEFIEPAPMINYVDNLKIKYNSRVTPSTTQTPPGTMLLLKTKSPTTKDSTIISGPRIPLNTTKISKPIESTAHIPLNKARLPISENSTVLLTKITNIRSTLIPPKSTNAKPPSVVRYICTSKRGGLGNQIFQFATSFGVAFSKGMRAVITKSNVVNAVFNLQSNQWLAVMTNRSKCNGAKRRLERLASGYDPNLVNFSNDASYQLSNCLQSWRYFNKSFKELRKQLVFRTHIQAKADSILNDILRKFGISSREDVTFISVHVRRGDMVNHRHGYQVATKEYILKAVNYFSNITNRVFVVCSNDMKWSRDAMPKTERIEFVTGNSREVDMAVLASCDHIISTVGSFSWWAGFLNKGTVIYYKWPAKEGSPLRSAYSKDYSDYFLPQWIGL